MVRTESRGDTSAFRDLVGKSDGKKPFERPRFRWEDNIKLNLEETRRDLVDLIYVMTEEIGGVF